VPTNGLIVVDALTAPDVSQDQILFILPLWWNDDCHRFSNNLFCAVAKKSLRALVPAHDDAIDVLAYYRIITGLDDGSEPHALEEDIDVTVMNYLLQSRLVIRSSAGRHSFIKLLLPVRSCLTAVGSRFNFLVTASEKLPALLHSEETSPQRGVGGPVRLAPGIKRPLRTSLGFPIESINVGVSMNHVPPTRISGTRNRCRIEFQRRNTTPMLLNAAEAQRLTFART
jgi:hypothetical protein